MIKLAYVARWRVKLESSNQIELYHIDCSDVEEDLEKSDSR